MKNYTKSRNEAIDNILDTIDEFNQRGGVSLPIELITEMMSNQFLFLSELVQAGNDDYKFTASELNLMTYSSHILIKFIVDLLGQYDRYERLVQECPASYQAESDDAKLEMENIELKKQIDYLQQIIIEKERTISALMASGIMHIRIIASKFVTL